MGQLYNVYLFFLFIFYFGEVFSKRRLMVNLYSTEENKLLKNSREKRSLEIENYCTKNGCCDSRNDDCHLIYIGKNATCYCDDFCDQALLGHVDCCPDFWTTCIGQNIREPSATNVPLTLFPEAPDGKGCFKDGSYYQETSIQKYNCNYCYCHENQWRCTHHTCLVEPEFINFINKGDFGWKADNYSQFWGMTLSEGFEYRLGTKSPSSSLLSMSEMTHRVSSYEEFPLFFISSYKWPNYIHRPLDQKNCAASWAFSTASVAADRVAIHSQGRYTSNLSPQDLISCNVHNQDGCRGGHIDSAWWFLRKRGVVSHECYPYEMDDNTNAYNKCNISSFNDEHGKSHATTQCPNQLEDSNYLYQCSPPYRVPSNEREIMKEIMENGPVQAIMTVHEDFFLYKTGIYKYIGMSEKKHGKKGTHSVKIIGWGALRRPTIEKFWIVANSWGNKWGENGYFRITRGDNECGVESLIIGAWCHIME
ncbi:tubulointerstitial nephritis antigen isoform X1 [Dendrobates tinctorius]|uniref:tubulointerstitial nephritis antigen isoform X1 n=1 Tax=Dendrobates tinctorius TaxID=92724 RepID=UPI003CC9A0A6